MIELAQDCSICSDINCSNCPTSKQLGIIPAIITAVAAIGTTVYSIQSQKKLAEKQRRQAEEDLKALQELEKQKQQAQLNFKMLELGRPSGLASLGMSPTTLILIGTGLVFVFMLMSILKR